MRYVFADCVLDTALATLHRAGRAIPLWPNVRTPPRFSVPNAGRQASYALDTTIPLPATAQGAWMYPFTPHR